jgi:hypothetical protein
MPESSTNETSNRPDDPAVEAAARGRFVGKKETTGRRKRHQRHREQQQQAPPPIGAEVIGAYSIEQFCAAHGGISEAFFHKLVSEGRGPKLMKVGGRTLVSVEAAREWRRACEAATAA